MTTRRVADIIALAKLGWSAHVAQRDAAGGADPPNHGEWLLIKDLVTALTERQQEVKARLTVVREALATYGQHKSDCASGRLCQICGKPEEERAHAKEWGHYFEPHEDCTCGLDVVALRVDTA